MNDCPVCGAPCQEQNSFCGACGATLKVPEADLFFCTECGTRVPASQKLCHNCQSPLATSYLEQSPAIPPGYQVALTGWRAQPRGIALVGASLLVIFLGIWWFFLGHQQPRLPMAPSIPGEPKEKSAPAPSPQVLAPAPAVKPAVAPLSPATESLPTVEVIKKQLEELLQNMREAQLKKDLDRYMEFYSRNFPDLDKKRQTTMKNWDLYNYLDLEFKLDEVKLLITGNALAQVTWNIKYQNADSDESKKFTQTFKVWFSNETNTWRIDKLELVGKN